jgi:hypothetical protein
MPAAIKILGRCGQDQSDRGALRRQGPTGRSALAGSEKQDNGIANRKERRRNRQILSFSLDEPLLMTRREAGNPWQMEKDGQAFFDPQKHPELMRK